MNTVVNDLSTILAQQLQAGSGSARASMGGKTVAFAWADRLVNSTISHVASAVSESTQASALKVMNTTPVVPVTDGTQKPITATLANAPVTLKTYPGVCEVTTSQIVDSANLGAAIQIALYNQALLALDHALVTDLLAAPNGIAKAADVAAIAEGQAQLLGQGFGPGIVVMSPSVYATIVGGSSGILTSGGNPQAPVLQLFGSTITVSSSLVGAQAVVLDPNAVSAIEHASSPVALVDVHARNNKVDVVVELLAGHLVTQDLGICPIKVGSK